VSNVDQKLKSYRDRAYRIDQEKRNAANDMRELKAEMKSNGLSKTEIAGVLLWVRQENESDDKKAARQAAQEVADMLAAAGAPLFASAA
jgi:uncharacterized protein (UPF0335 family)